MNPLSNFTYLSADETLFYSFFVIGPIGLFSNVLLLVPILKNKDIREKDYSIFIINRAIMDTLACTMYFTIQPLGVNYWSTNPIWCKVAGGIFFALNLPHYIAEPMLAFNRYVAICHSNLLYFKIFQKRNIFFMCLLTWLFGMLFNLPSSLQDVLGKIPGLFCSLNLNSGGVHLIVFTFCYPLFLVSYSTMAFCYVKIYRFLKIYQNQSLPDGQRTRLQEDRSLLRYIAVVAAVPIIAEIPLAITAAMNTNNRALVPDFAIFASSVIFLMCPVVNPILTLYILRPIRKEFFRIVRHLANRSNTPVISLQPCAINF